jgi:ribosome-associated translation inhibitor RaiA
MKVNIRGNGQVKLSPAAREDIEAKIASLDKLFNRSESINANVLCKGYDKYSVVEVTIPIPAKENKMKRLFSFLDKDEIDGE